MKLKDLRRIERALWRAREKTPKEDLKYGLGEELDKLFWKIYNQVREQEITHLATKDKGQAVWTIYYPPGYHFHRRWIKRTAHLVIEEAYTGTISTEKAWRDPWQHFAALGPDGLMCERSADYLARLEQRCREERLRHFPEWALP